MPINLLPLAVVRIDGDNAHKFLQNQLTCDLSNFTEQHCQFGAWCNHQGRVICSLYVIKHNAYYLLLVPAVMATILLTRIQKFALVSKVKLVDVSDELAVVGVISEENINRLSQQFKLTIPRQDYAVVSGEASSMIRLPGHTARALLITPTSGLSELPVQDSAAFLNDWQLIDIAAGITHITLNTTELFTVHQLNYLNIHAASLHKGCYPGQEIIARTEYRGKPKQHLYQVTLDTEQLIKAGDKLLDDQQQLIGEIVNICPAGKNSFTALATLFDSAAQQRKITLASPAGALQISYQ